MKLKTKPKSVMVVGAGPAGVTCAYHLARRGHQVTVYERLGEPGGMSAVGMGFLFAASILVAGIGVGGAVLFAEGVDPRSLSQPQNLMKVDQLLNFSEHPLNIIYMVSLGITFLALLGSYRMGKLAMQANARTRASTEEGPMATWNATAVAMETTAASSR